MKVNKTTEFKTSGALKFGFTPYPYLCLHMLVQLCFNQNTHVCCLPYFYIQGNNIHAQIYPNVHDQFKDLIKEGNVYNFSYFRVKHSNNKYKPVTNNQMLSFSKWTTIEEVLEIPPAFPLHTYSLTPLDQVPARVDYTEYYTGKAMSSCAAYF